MFYIIVIIIFQVVVKYIRKSKLTDDNWVNSRLHGRVPLEIYLLRTLIHPNIVQVIISCHETLVSKMWRGSNNADISIHRCCFRPCTDSIFDTLWRVLHCLSIEVLDNYEGTNFLQMVMEKHGSGIDLFEFIEGSSVIPEPVCSFIFRQVCYEFLYDF